MSKIRIGTRSSLLAVTQAQRVKNLLIDDLGIDEDRIEIIKFKTSGDKFKDISLADIGGKGLFIKELEEALITNKIDVAVHSAKDVPPEVRGGTQIAAFLKRRRANEYFISKKYNSIDDLPSNATIGTSSARRKAILLQKKPGLEIVNFRGNVDTRLKKIEDEVVDATILAVCGLERLGREIEEDKIISIEEMLPSVGQGSLALQIRDGEDEIYQILRQINNQQSEICIYCERVFLQQLNASCKSPVSVYCQIKDGKLLFSGKIYDFDGSQEFVVNDEVEIGDLLSDFDGNYSEILQLSKGLATSMAGKIKKEAKILLEKICG